MELNNLVFASILGCLLVSGCLVYFSGIQSNYSPAQAVTSLPNISQTTNQLNILTQNATGASMTQSVGQDPVGALLGYFNSAFQAIKVLVVGAINVPGTFYGFINAIFVSFGLAGFGWVLSYVYIAIGMVTVIGIMYYLTKVK